ncbi:serine hydrolase domain-containing protein [Pseudonocardia sp. TRM90224]|uniref:serine hydrolase domain-containing protein n=1 Tax=Pseudonocardia sp. TRM90224 TaxID=2812678 RepID=UPI001E4AFC35|nr:serine hydrolase domain-containing protein [Pseudonocardia sp. TRM90224]
MNALESDVQAVLDQRVESGTERGLQAAVYRDGQLVVDAVAGIADVTTGRPVTSDTPFFATSTGKGVTATVVHVLVERGALGYDTRIADLWPEFAANGKGTATVADALTHRVGVPGLPVELTPDAFLDWDAMCALIAGAKPWWQPGTRTGYHAQTFGWIIGEIVRRATGRRISEVLRDEVAGPLGVADELFFGVPAEHVGRLARLEEQPAPEGEVEEISFGEPADAHDGWVWAPPACMPTAEYGNRADIMRTDVPAGATMTARAVARMYAALMHDVDSVRLISPARLEAATEVIVEGHDEIFGMPVRRALGYARDGLGVDEGSQTVFGMAGSGGCAAYADLATGVSIALMKNVNTYGDFSVYDEVVRTVAKHLR